MDSTEIPIYLYFIKEWTDFKLFPVARMADRRWDCIWRRMLGFLTKSTLFGYESDDDEVSRMKNQSKLVNN